jgi:nucleoside phosphorylase
MAAARRLGALRAPIGLLMVVAGLIGTLGTAAGPAGASVCTPRLLVLSAMPLELDPLLAQATVDPGSTALVDDRSFVTGTLAGDPVVMGLTGIGPENARATTSGAFAHYRCGGVSGISGVVFSGTSGGDDIGDVFVPRRWSEDGAHFFATDPAMYAVAASVAGGVPLDRTTPTGDPGCACALSAGLTTPVAVGDVPAVEMGGDGLTTDPFGGRTLPCAPAGSDVFGCVPCRERDQHQPAQAGAFAREAPAFAQPGFFASYLHAATPPGTWVSEDDETAAVAEVAAAQGVPFIGFRAASDGPGNTPGTGGDPLMLPGFPAQFVVYRQLAADNAAATAVAFLRAWRGHGT